MGEGACRKMEQIRACAYCKMIDRIIYRVFFCQLRSNSSAVLGPRMAKKKRQASRPHFIQNVAQRNKFSGTFGHDGRDAVAGERDQLIQNDMNF